MAVLLVRSYEAERDPQEINRVYDRNGSLLEVKMEPFASSLVGGAVSMQEVCIWQRAEWRNARRRRSATV